MKRFRQFLDFEKEERWLNEMVQTGQLLVKKRLRYHFTSIEPGSAVVRVDYRGRSMSVADFEDYRTMFADAGWQHLDGTRSGGAQYFAATGAAPDADIFSDAESRATRYRRSIAWRGAALLPFLVVLVTLLGQGNILVPPADWYLTPGLWDMEGGEFVSHFLFETPFALIRGAGGLFVLTVCIVLIVQIVVQNRLYRRATRS